MELIEKVINKLEKAVKLSEAANGCRVVIGYGLADDIIWLLKEKSLVQCNNCKNWCKKWDIDWNPTGRNGQMKEVHFCPIVDSITPSDWFCGSAKRRSLKNENK